MDKAFMNAVILSEDTNADIQVGDFLNAEYHRYYESKNRENDVYMNRKQIIADRVAKKFGQK